jgi:hypothetical protein
VWLNPSDVLKVDLVAAAALMEDAAKNISTQVQFTTDVDHAEGSVCVEYYLPESRQDLLALLLDDTSGFLETMVAHFELLAKFIHVVDDIFKTGKRSRK